MNIFLFADNITFWMEAFQEAAKGIVPTGQFINRKYMQESACTLLNGGDVAYDVIGYCPPRNK